MSMEEKWDRRFLDLARFVSSWSLDPSTQVGSCITRGKEIVSLGYNGFAKGVRDLPERYADREWKISTVVHAEINSILFARQDLTGCTLYTYPFASCSNCAGVVIQAGIKRCVAPKLPADKTERWGKSLERTTIQLAEAGVELVLLDYP